MLFFHTLNYKKIILLIEEQPCVSIDQTNKKNKTFYDNKRDRKRSNLKTVKIYSIHIDIYDIFRT